MISGKYVSKPWGNELWIADGIRTPYALKRILFNQGTKSSLQVHQFKFETNYVLNGRGILQLSELVFDCERYLANPDLKAEMTNEILATMTDIAINPGDIVDVKPGQVHRVIALVDLTFIEASTIELDDVIRLQDDAGRPDGKIESEHIN